MYSLFVGNKIKPNYLIEVIPNKKTISIYKPDKYSKNEEFYERYSLGELIDTMKYNNILFVKKPISYKRYLFCPEVIFKIKNKYIFISNNIKVKDTL